jgi:hypothetical protein
MARTKPINRVGPKRYFGGNTIALRRGPRIYLIDTIRQHRAARVLQSFLKRTPGLRLSMRIPHLPKDAKRNIRKFL